MNVLRDPNRKAPSTQMEQPVCQRSDGRLTNGNHRNAVMGGQSKEGCVEPTWPVPHGQEAWGRRNKQKKEKGSLYSVGLLMSDALSGVDCASYSARCNLT